MSPAADVGQHPALAGFAAIQGWHFVRGVAGDQQCSFVDVQLAKASPSMGERSIFGASRARCLAAAWHLVGGVPLPPEWRALGPGPAGRRVWAAAREVQWQARTTRGERGAVADRVEVPAQEKACAWARTLGVPLSTRLC